MRIRTRFLIELAGGVGNTALLIVLTPILVKLLGMERYGVLLFVLGFTVYIGVADFGLSSATSQRIASCSEHERAKVFGAALALSVLFGSLAGTLFSLLSLHQLGDWIHLTKNVAHELSKSTSGLFLLGTSVVIAGVPQGALLGLARFTLLNVMTVIATALSILAPAAYAILLGGDLSGLIMAVALGRFLTIAIGLMMCASAGLLPSWWPVDTLIARRILGYGGWSTVMAVMHRATNSVDRPIIGALCGAAAVPIFAIPQGLVNRSNFIGPALMSAVFPSFAAEANPNGGEQILAHCYHSMLVLTPLYVLGIIALPEMLHLWLGSRIGSSASIPAVLIAASAWIDTISSVPYVYIQAKAKVSREVAIAAAIAIPNILILMFATRFAGVTGAAATSVARSIAYLSGRVSVTGRTHFPLRDFLLQASVIFLAATQALFQSTSWIAYPFAVFIFASSCAITVVRLPSFATEMFQQILTRIQQKKIVLDP